MFHEVRVMKNVTITLPDEVALQARIWAAEADTSVSSFLCGMLTARMETESRYKQAGQEFLSRPPVRLREKKQRYPSRDDLHDRARLR